MTKAKYAWERLGVSLAWLVELDDLPAPNALADAFGDRYLYHHNPAFACLRDAALDLGYRFSAEDTPLWRDYQALSLVSLDRILAARTIPYLDTGAVFRRLIEANPAAHLPLGFIASSLRQNHVFHESAHCVAHSIMRRRATDVWSVAPVEADRIVLEAVLAESFANTVEAVGSVFGHSPIADRTFYLLNSHVPYDEKREDVLSRAGDGLGAGKRFTLLFLSYLEANLATKRPDDSVYERIAEAGDCGASETGLTREIADLGFRLTAGFREMTTPVYFDWLGRAREYNTLAGTKWLSNDSNQNFVRTLAHAFWRAAGSV